MIKATPRDLGGGFYALRYFYTVTDANGRIFTNFVQNAQKPVSAPLAPTVSHSPSGVALSIYGARGSHIWYGKSSLDSPDWEILGYGSREDSNSPEVRLIDPFWENGKSQYYKLQSIGQ